jgi:S-methylmethionine-dependent homocysteine/selenocysteine methylase
MTRRETPEVLHSPDALRRRLSDGPPLLLDGATGTELERRGAHTALPLWSAHALLTAPQLVEQIHRDYVQSGAEVLTANTFRTQRRALSKGGVADRTAELTERAARLARRAARATPAGRRVWVAGSVSPLEDCYRPDRVPEDAALEREHDEHVGNLVQAGVDLLLVETMNTIREAEAATRAARRRHAAVLVSFVADAEARLLSGEPLAEAVEAIAPLEPLGVLVNCLPPSAVHTCLAVLRRFALPHGVYANLGEPDGATGFTRTEECAPEEFAEHAASWQAAGARILGGCCGTTPDHLRAVAERLAG